MHKNARLTPRGRALLVARLESGQHRADVAQAMGVSLTTVKKWLKCYRSEGAAGLPDRSSRPRSSPLQLAPALVTRIVELRRGRRTGRFIASELGVSAASVSRVLQRARLSRWRDLQPAVPIVRYEREHPGELVHLDIKKLGRIVRPSHRVTGNRRDTVEGAGWEFVHVAIDDASRLAMASIANDERGTTVAQLLETTVADYACRGVKIERVMTDNGSAYLSHAFRDACRRLGIRHLRTKPYTPRTNGKAERFIQTALREWAYASAYASSADRGHALGRWLHHYNWHRPHSALHCQPPISRLPIDGNNLLRLHN
jgi:transposase InsO family protein